MVVFVFFVIETQIDFFFIQGVTFPTPKDADIFGVVVNFEEATLDFGYHHILGIVPFTYGGNGFPDEK
jgi:hypothetical protein